MSRPFAAETRLPLGGLSIPESSPTSVEPVATRIFPAPDVSGNGATTVFFWLVGAAGPVGVSVWTKAGAVWIHLGSTEASANAASSGIVVPAGAPLFVQVTSGAAAGELQAGVRGPAPGDSTSGGIAGDASAANQATQIAQLADILSEVTGSAKDTSVQAVEAAIVDLADGATIADVVAKLTDDATTQAAILAKLTEIDVDTDASAATLLQIETAVDDLETLAAAIRDRLPVVPTPDLNAGAASFTHKSGAGVLYALSLGNRGSTTLYVFVFDSVTASGAQLVTPLLLPANSDRIVGTDFFTARGIAFSTGCTVGFSTSASSYSAHGTPADCYSTAVVS